MEQMESSEPVANRSQSPSPMLVMGSVLEAHLERIEELLDSHMEQTQLLLTQAREPPPVAHPPGFLKPIPGLQKEEAVSLDEVPPPTEYVFSESSSCGKVPETKAIWSPRQTLANDGPSVESLATTPAQAKNAATVASLSDEDYRTVAMRQSAPMWRTESAKSGLFDVTQAGAAGINQFFKKIVESTTFEIFFCILILTNSITIGLETDLAHQSGTAERTFFWIGTTYTILFTIEFVLKLWVYGCAIFKGKDRAWSFLDLFIVVSSLADLGLSIAIAVEGEADSDASGGGMANLRIIRITRIVRLLRVFRVARVVRFISALRQLMVSIVSTLRALVWAMLLLLMIIYVFAILFTQAARDYLVELETGQTTKVLSDEILRDLQEYWGSLATSMFSLFKSISDGVSWHTIVKPLHEISIAWAAVFTVFITFTYFAVLNVLTAVFCQTAIDSEKQDDDIMIQSMMGRKELYIRQLTNLYHTLDPKQKGNLTFADMEAHFAVPSVKAHFSSLDLEPDDALVLFKLLDADSTFGIDLEEFVMGCLRLRGFAKSVDMAKLLSQHRTLLNKLNDFIATTEESFAEIRDGQQLQEQMAAQMQHRLARSVNPSGMHRATSPRGLLPTRDGRPPPPVAARFANLVPKLQLQGIGNPPTCSAVASLDGDHASTDA